MVCKRDSISQYESRKAQWRKGALGLALAAGCFLSIHCSEEPPKLADGKVIYEFLANAKNAEIAEYQRPMVHFGPEFTINTEKRTVLFEHPVTDIRFGDIPIPHGAVLQFGIGIKPEVWDKPGDGVTFEITLVDQKEAKILIFSKYIDPKNNRSERKWFDQDVDLEDFASQKVAFIFSTTAGPRANADFDLAGWSDPRIRLKN